MVKSAIQNPQCHIRTVTAVLKILPESFRSKYSAFFRSRSLQGPFKADYENPRVIVIGSQPKPKFMLSFNGDPNQPGYLELEIADINTSGSKDDLGVFKYYGKNS